MDEDALMNRGAVLSEPVIAWGVAARALPGQVVSGDLHLVMSFNGGVLLAAVDGIGHGVEAMTAADLAVRTLQLHPEEPPVSLIRRCHAALMRTRGVVMTLASVRTSEGEMAWL